MKIWVDDFNNKSEHFLINGKEYLTIKHERGDVYTFYTSNLKENHKIQCSIYTDHSDIRKKAKEWLEYVLHKDIADYTNEIERHESLLFILCNGSRKE